MSSFMDAGLLAGVPFRIRVIFLGMVMGAVGLPMLFVAFFAKDEPLARSVVIGCYSAPNAPALNIRMSEIQIVEPQRRSMSYVPERSKVSYQLSVKPALQLTMKPDGQYRFEQGRGIGYFWPLLPDEGRNRNRMRHPNEYSGRFEVHSSDGQRVVYSRQSRRELCTQS